jgi:hypothetical protein
MRELSSYEAIPKDSQPVISKEEKKQNDRLWKKYVDMQRFTRTSKRAPAHSS